MKDTSKRLPVAEQIRKGLEEAIRHAKGEITLKTTVVELPDEPPEIDAPTLVALRDQARMSQAVFARLLNVSTRTVQSWEQGLRSPSHASRRLIQIFSQHPEVVCQSVGLTAVALRGVTIVRTPEGRRRIVIEGSSGSRTSRETSSRKPAPQTKPRSKRSRPNPPRNGTKA